MCIEKGTKDYECVYPEWCNMDDPERRERESKLDHKTGYVIFLGDTIFSGHKDQGPTDQNWHTVYMQFAVFSQYSISRVSIV